MSLLHFRAEGFRNLCTVSFDCAPALTLISGPNAAGKTSVLEALYTLGRGRSFRTRRSAELIARGGGQFSLFACLDPKAGAERVGLGHDGRSPTLRVDGRTLRSSAEVVRLLPTLLLTPGCGRLLTAPPQMRRRFIDWGVFQHDEAFWPLWQRFSTALRQRNRLLRLRASVRELLPWEQQMAHHGEQIDALRALFCQRLAQGLPAQLETLFGRPVHSGVEYRRGWPQERPLASLLDATRERDLRMGYSLQGPQRADLALRLDGLSAAQLSAGQLKLFAIGLVLTQAQLFSQQQKRRCLLLIDDLAAELDPNHRQRTLQALVDSGQQCVMTALAIDTQWRGDTEARTHYAICDGAVRKML